MKWQKGQALILAVIWLAVAALTIVPVLRIMYTAMKSQRISENALATLSTDDSALRIVLAQLKNQLMGTFIPGNPSTVFNFVYSGRTYNSTIQIPSVPPSVLIVQGKVTLLIDAQPPWIESTANGTNYVIRIGTEPWASSTGTYEYTLPLGFTYAPNSAYVFGPAKQNQWNASYPFFPVSGDPTKPGAEVNTTTHQVKLADGSWKNMLQGVGRAPTIEYINQGDPPQGVTYDLVKSYLVVTTLLDGRQHIKFKPYYDFTGTGLDPNHYQTGGNRFLIQTIHANGSAWGVHYLTQGNFAIGSDTVTFTQTAATGVAMYVIVIPIGGVNYQVTVAWDTLTNSFKIVSYSVLQ